MNSTIGLVSRPGVFVTKFGWFPLFFFILSSDVSAYERMFYLKIGPTWPSRTSASWDAEFMYGYFIDKKVGFGVAADFLWNTSTHKRDVGGGLDTTLKEESSYMFPIMGFIVFDPLPYQMIHPMLKFEIGYNSMQYNSKPPGPTDHPGYYNGLIVKAGVDGLYNLGEQAAIFLGIEYQWADMSTKKDSSGYEAPRDMGGVGLHIGFRFLL